MSRLNYNILLIGKRGTGKTTQAIKLAGATGKRIIVVNTDRHPAYTSFDEITPDKLKAYRGKKCVVYCADEDEADQVATTLNKYQSNAIVVFEDAQKYVDQNISKPFKRLVINHRMRNFDVVFMYHYLDAVPPYLCKQYNMMFLFKTTDGNINLSKKYGNWDVINARRHRVNAHRNEHYCEVIQDNEAA